MSQRDRNRQHTRESILRAAQVLMTRDGAAGTSVVEVAELAGVSDTTVFNYFKTKADLLDAVIAEAASATDLAALLSARPPGEGPFAALRAIIADSADNGAEFAAAETARFLAAVRSDGALWGSYLRINHEMGDTLAGLFAERAPDWTALQARLAAHAAVAALSALLLEVTSSWTAADIAGHLDEVFTRLDWAWPATPETLGVDK